MINVKEIINSRFAVTMEDGEKLGESLNKANPLEWEPITLVVDFEGIQVCSAPFLVALYDKLEHKNGIAIRGMFVPAMNLLKNIFEESGREYSILKDIYENNNP